jgi:hypothetical protein
MIKLLKKLFASAPEENRRPETKAQHCAANIGERSNFQCHSQHVALGLHYREIKELMGRTCRVRSQESGESEVLKPVRDYVQPSQIKGSFLPFGSGPHRRFGLMDVRLPARKELLDSETQSGLDLLVSLDFVDRDKNEMMAEDAERLAEDVKRGEVYLCLMLVETGFRNWSSEPWLNICVDLTQDAATTAAPKAEKFNSDENPKFPLELRIADACVSNSTHVWMYKHVYW